MTSPSTLFADSPEPGLEPEPDQELELELEPEPEPETAPIPELPPAALAPVALMQVLPVGFPLPALIRFVPNVALKADLDRAVAYASAIEVQGSEGYHRADLALVAVRVGIKAIEEEFAEPAETANQLHKRLTTMRGEWVTAHKATAQAIGQRVARERLRLESIEKEKQRKEQDEKNRLAREEADREAAAAKRANAPAPVVEELQRRAATATAPPVAPTASAPAPLQGSTVVKSWKARPVGTPACDESNPEIEALSPAQRLALFHLVVNVAAQLARDLKLALEPEHLTKCQGAPVASLAFNWSYLNNRAKSDKSTLAIPGIEAWEDVGLRAKATRIR